MTNSGIVTQYFDQTSRPQDDLFRHVNGQWLDNYDIPPDRGADGAFRELHDAAEQQVRLIIEEANGQAAGDSTEATEERLIAALYASFMDADQVERRGLEPLQADIAAVAEADKVTLAKVIGQLERTGVGGLFDTWVDNDPGQPTRYIVNLSQGGLGLPDEAYYREDQHAEIRQHYVGHVAAMLDLATAGDANPVGQASGLDTAAQADRIMALETALADAHWDVVKDRDQTLTYNPSTWQALQQEAAHFPWTLWAEGLGWPVAALDDVIVREPSFFTALDQLWLQTDLADWQLWMTWHIVHARAAFLTAALVDENFRFYGQTLQGTPQIRDRWKRGVSFVEGSVGEAVGRRYTQRHFPPTHKARMVTLVDHLLAAYRQSITELDWLSPDTKAKALVKLDQFTAKIGYPDRWRDYSRLTADPADLIANVRAVNQFETDRELAKLGRPIDRDEWYMTPQTVNAYYNPGMNEIVFPAAILQPPFFTADGDDAANFGGIGAVIGHEIGHGFDDQGSKYDGTGALTDWWTADDRARFEARTAALIDQYNQFELDLPTGPRPVNGALTIGENIGDLGGLAIAWKAYQIALDGAEAPVIDGWTAAQRFFFGWSQCWRAKTRPEEAALRLAVDPHSPDRFRCNGTVRNLDQFHEAFSTTSDDALWLDPQERVTIW